MLLLFNVNMTKDHPSPNTQNQHTNFMPQLCTKQQKHLSKNVK